MSDFLNALSGAPSISSSSNLSLPPDTAKGSFLPGVPSTVDTSEVTKSPFTAGNVISSAFSALAKFHEFRSKAAQLEVQAQFEGLRAKADFAAGQQQAASIQAATASAAASVRNNFAASGIDVGGGGTVQFAIERTLGAGGEAASDARLAGEIAKLTRRMNQRNLLIAAKNARAMAPLAAIGSLVGDFMRIANPAGGT